MNAGQEPAPKLVESIPPVSGTVKLPKLVQSRASFIANMVVAGVCGAGALGMLIVGIVATL